MDRNYQGKSVPDGGYGWCVCLAACSMQFILAGIENSFGILYIYILDEFGGGKAKAAWVGSIHQCALYAFAPFVTMACDVWGCRITAFVGGVMCVIGLGASSFVTRLYLLFITYGLIFGGGASLVFITTYRAISQWFNRHLALVNGICTAGQYSSTVVCVFTVQYSVEHKGLSTTLAILAGISSVIIPLSLVYRQPLPETPDERESQFKPSFNWRKLLDITLLKDKSFVIFLLGISLYATGCYVPATHAPSFAKEEGVPQNKLPYLLVAWSISSCVFSFCTGKLADTLRTHRVKIFQAIMTGVACSTSLISGAWRFEVFLLLMVLYGAFDSGFVLLRAVVTEDLVGSKKSSRGVGIMFGALSLAYLAGIPLAGGIFDVTRSYPLSFIVASVFSASGCCLLFLISSPQKPREKVRTHNSMDSRRMRSPFEQSCNELLREPRKLSLQLESNSLRETSL